MFEVRAIPAFSDNYIWAVVHTPSMQALVVDPGDANAVLPYLKEHGLLLEGILITHSHLDHTAGIDGLLEAFDIPVHAPNSPEIPQATHTVQDGDKIEFHGAEFFAIHTPGHLPEHVSFYAMLDQTPVLFSGDTLFSGGCGRIFSGTHDQLHESLTKLGALPRTTKVYCAHEYTLANLAFAKAVEPDNEDLRQHLAHIESVRADNKISLPSTIGLEKAINPFLRTHEPSVCATVAAREGVSPESLSPLAVFTHLREWKNSF